MNKLFAFLLIFFVSVVFFTPNVKSADVSSLLTPIIIQSEKNDTSPEFHTIQPIPPVLVVPGEVIREIPMMPLHEFKKGPTVPEKGLSEPDPALQRWHGSFNMPLPTLNFGGVNNLNGVLPPDTNGDVGPNHYIQWVNLSFAIWDKSGTLLYGPMNGNTLWTGFGGPCETSNDGDPIVLYDHLADRWFMSQFALPNYPNGPFYQCIAVSSTPDPTGAWYRYQYSFNKMNDYPKFGVWSDGYYMSINQFASGSQAWAGAGVAAFERDKMLQGLSAQMVYFDLYSVNSNFGGLLPSDLDGPPSTAGTPNFFVEMDDDAWGWPTDRLSLWEFHVDWANPANSTFGLSGNPNVVMNTAPFDSNLCNYSRNCIPQKGTSVKLDAISDRLMFRLQYRNFGTHQAMVTNHTVDVGSNHAGIRWYELRNSGSGWAIYQQGTYAPDADHRWMSSIAMDGQGNIALGFSVSSSTLYPSIRYVGRLVSDPLNTLPQAETELIAGAGYQTHSSGRWGDYSMMAVDPTDNCTFWYTQEYYAIAGSAPWQTRIGAFNFPSCSALSNVSVTVVPDSPTVPRGGTLGYTVRLTNNTSSSQTFKYWAYLKLPNGNRYPPTGELVGPITVTLSPSQIRTAHLTLKIPRKAPLGTYTYYGNVGPYPAIWDSDSFEFTVTATGIPEGSASGDWEVLENELSK